MLPLFAFAYTVEVGIRLVSGGSFPGWSVVIAPVAQSLLWPVVSVLLLVPQRRAPDRDQNRPL